MKIYMAGIGGMLGQAFHKAFQGNELKCTDKDVNEDWISYLDFNEYGKYYLDVRKFNPDWLFHIGALTDLEYCEKNRKETYQTNFLSVVGAVQTANQLKIPLLYISTAGIFDGKKNLYGETDEPNPLGEYGKSKYLGEEFVINKCNDYLICRAGWMMGGGRKKDKKFVNKIIKQIDKGVDRLYVVNDKDGTPTYTHDFANNVKLLIEKDKRGLYNMVCGGETSRFEVAQEIVKNLEKDIEVIPVSSDFFAKEYFAERPPSERLINKRLNEEGLNIMRDWKTCLKEYLEEFK